MKHHLYQIYYGGFKIKLKNMYFCEDCNKVSSWRLFQIATRHKNTDLTNEK